MRTAAAAPSQNGKEQGRARRRGSAVGDVRRSAWPSPRGPRAAGAVAVRGSCRRSWWGVGVSVTAVHAARSATRRRSVRAWRGRSSRVCRPPFRGGRRRRRSVRRPGRRGGSARPRRVGRRRTPGSWCRTGPSRSRARERTVRRRRAGCRPRPGPVRWRSSGVPAACGCRSAGCTRRRRRRRRRYRVRPGTSRRTPHRLPVVGPSRSASRSRAWSRGPGRRRRPSRWCRHRVPLR